MRSTVAICQFEGATTLAAFPLAAGLIAATARADPALAAGFDITVRSRREEPAQVVASLANPAVVGLSCYAWNLEYSLEIARCVRAAYPHTLIVLGGPSIPRSEQGSQAFFDVNPSVDVLVFGEGEVTFRELLLARLSETTLDTVSGIAFRRDGQLHHTAPRERLRDFEHTTSPYLSGLFAGSEHQATGAIIETNRGCPFACTYCDWGQAIASRVNELPLERVYGELEWAANRSIPYLYIIDANFGIRPRDAQIVRYIAELRQRTGYPHYVSFHLTKNATAKNLDTVRTLTRAGIGSQVALSMQDFDEAVLAAVERANISLDSALALRSTCNDLGIPTFNELLLGLPAQTLSSFRRSMIHALSPFPHDSFNLYLCRLLVNAELASLDHRARFGLETRRNRVPDAAHVDEFEEVVVGTRALPTADWERGYRFGYMVSAGYNMGFLRVVIQYLQHDAQLDLAAWFDGLLDAMAVADAASPLGQMESVFQRYVGSILAGGPLRLDGREISEALAVVALEHGPALLEQIRDLTEGGPVLDDLFAFQRFVNPSWPGRRTRRATFLHDWITYSRNAGRDPELVERPTRMLYQPPAHALLAPDREHFLRAHFAANYARIASGIVVEH